MKQKTFDLTTLVNRENTGNLKELLTPECLKEKQIPAFNAAEMDFKTAPSVICSMKECVEQGLFGFTLCDSTYLNAVAWWMKTQRKFDCRPEWIIPTLGTIFSLASCIRMVVGKEEQMIVQAPVYNRYKQAADRQGRKTVVNQLIRREDGSYGIDFEDLERKMADPKSRLLVLCNPQNPLGCVWKREDLERIALLAKKYDVVVYSDEIFADYSFTEEGVFPYIMTNNGDNNGITATSLGKTFNFTGVNHANMIIRDEELRERFIRQRFSDHYGSLDPVVRAAVLGACCEEGAAWKDAVGELIRENIQKLMMRLPEIAPGAVLSPVEGGYVAWISWKKLGLSDTELKEFFEKEALFVPEFGEDFCTQEEGYTRVNLATTREAFSTMLDRLEAAFKKMPEKKVYLTLKPSGDNRSLAVKTVMPGCVFKKGEVFDSLPNRIAVCPSADYDDSHISFSDDAGIIPFESLSDVGMLGPQKTWRFLRDTKGIVTAEYTALVRTKDPWSSDPGFTMYHHDHGVTAAGLVFLLLPKLEKAMFCVSWDFSQCPADYEGISGFGIGNFIRFGSSEDLKNTFYLWGTPKVFKSSSGKFYAVSLDEGISHLEGFAERAGVYYDYMSTFFRDTSSFYCMIIYNTPRTELTGTALLNTVYLGLGDKRISSMEQIENTLCHELTHNWEITRETGAGADSLLSEGFAEYYSGYMQVYAGGASKDEWVRSVNGKLRAYYSNPRNADNLEEVYQESWTRDYAQRIPYGRGLILMMELDSAIRKNTSGKNSLDDLAVEIAVRHQQGVDMSLSELAETAASLGGEKAEKAVSLALSDGLMIPPADYFGEEYQLVNIGIRNRENGFDDDVLFQSPKIVKGLVKGSNAWKAGLRNGDEILRRMDDWQSLEDDTLETGYIIKRDGKELEIRYIARGTETIPCWQYVKK